MVLCKQFYLILILNVITHRATCLQMWESYTQPTTMCSVSTKRISEPLMDPDAPKNLSDAQPALSMVHKSISATQMPETHLQTNYRTGAAAMFYICSVLYF